MKILWTIFKILLIVPLIIPMMFISSIAVIMIIFLDVVKDIGIVSYEDSRECENFLEKIVEWKYKDLFKRNKI